MLSVCVLCFVCLRARDMAHCIPGIPIDSAEQSQIYVVYLYAHTAAIQASNLTHEHVHYVTLLMCEFWGRCHTDRGDTEKTAQMMMADAVRVGRGC